MGAISHEAHDLIKKITIMVYRWKTKNPGKLPRYLFLSTGAYLILKGYEGMEDSRELEKFMGIEVALVGVPGVYASVGEEF